MTEDILSNYEKEMKWQIAARPRIQELLFDLYRFLDRYAEFPNETDDQCWTNMVWMVEAAFSLWRSAFLTDTVRDRKTIYKDKKDFIQKVLEMNAITFADDHRLRGLTVGYYNANARYRLERLHDSNPGLLLEFKSVRTLADLRTHKVDCARKPQSDMWDIYFDALSDTFKWFSDDWKQTKRPYRRPTPAEAIAVVVTAVDGSKTELPSDHRQQPPSDGQGNPQLHTRSSAAWPVSAWDGARKMGNPEDTGPL